MYSWISSLGQLPSCGLIGKVNTRRCHPPFIHTVKGHYATITRHFSFAVYGKCFQNFLREASFISRISRSPLISSSVIADFWGSKREVSCYRHPGQGRSSGIHFSPFTAGVSEAGVALPGVLRGASGTKDATKLLFRPMGCGIQFTLLETIPSPSVLAFPS